MRNKKRETDQKAGLTFKGEVTAMLSKLEAEITSRQRKLLFEQILSVLVSMVSAILASLVGLVFAFSDRPTIPSEYVYLVTTILSSIAGISIIFLFARWIYRKRKRERVELIKQVRLKELELFMTFQLDFEHIIHRKEPNG